MKKRYLYWLLCLLFFVSCEDDYHYDDEEPSWLGQSIYDYLNEQDNYKYFVRLIEDCGRKEELQRTGSNTLFVCEDEAFERFFQSNEWGVSDYDSFTEDQKNQILKFSMLKNASLIETLSSGVGYRTGQVLRLETYLEPVNMVGHYAGTKLPESPWFNPYANDGLYMVKDNTSPMLVLFSEAYMKQNSISNTDFSYVMNGVSRNRDDAHIFDVKIKDNTTTTTYRDITCKNGYVHVLEDLVIPRQNMADYIGNSNSMTVFNSLMEGFSAPIYSADVTSQYRLLNPGFNDSIFVKRFYNSHTYNNLRAAPDGSVIPSTELLLFDPGWNAYRATTTDASQDMAALFVPSDAAMEEYFNNGSGKFLQERYGSWEKVPKNITSLFINAHMRYSMVSALPSRFDGIKDEVNGAEMYVSSEDIESAYIAANGLVYLTNKVYPPVDYSSVIAPILVSENAQVWNWAVTNCQFNLYLNSMESTYSFFIPTDEYLNDYRCPVYYAHSPRENWKFWFNSDLDQVVATRYDANTNDSIGLVTSTSILRDRFQDMLDYHVVVGNVESGDRYYITKGGGFIEVEGKGVGMKVWGGGNREMGTTAVVTEVFPMSNGNSYIIDRQIQQPVTSLYQTLRDTPEFSSFFGLCTGASNFFVSDPIYPGYDYNVSFFSAYHYTVYVPTNDAIQRAIDNGLPTWAEINSEGNATIKRQKTEKLVNFLKYHFQDNSVYLWGEQITDKTNYATAASYVVSGTNKYKFYSLGVTNIGNEIKVEDGAGRTVNITPDTPYYNLMIRDYGFGCSSAGDVTTSSSIEFSSRVVVHQINDYLLYEKDQLSQ